MREYTTQAFPTHDPDEKTHLTSILDEKPPAQDGNSGGLPATTPSYYPYPNWSSFRLGTWFWNNSTMSQSSFQELLEILVDPEFDCADLGGVNWKVINEKLVLGESQPPSNIVADDSLDNWQESQITISVPIYTRANIPGSFEYEAATLCHRSILSAIRTKITDPEGFANFHLEPYRVLWQPGRAPRTVRVHGEVYTSDAFIDAHEELQRSPPEPDCELQRVIVALVFASDATHISDYGYEKLWPLYLAFGNESKYRRSEESCRAFEHIAYFEKVRVAIFPCFLTF